MTISLNNKKITRRRVYNNILRVYNQSGEGSTWYEEARHFALTELSAVPESKAIGVLVSLSPMKYWRENKRIAKLFISGIRTGLHTNLYIQKAQAILDSDGSDEAILNILNGNKIKAFYLNIRYPDCPKNVTIDRHAVSIAMGRRLGEGELSLTTRQYAFFEDCYKYSANRIGISPVKLQAKTWVAWREKKVI